MIIFFYLARNFINKFLLVMAFLLALNLIVDGIGQYEVVRALGASLSDCIIYVIMRIPQNLYQFLPLAILISALIFFMGLARHSEIVALRASGISAIKIVSVPLLMSLIIGLIATIPMNSILVGSHNLTDNYLDKFKNQPSQIVRSVNNGVWLRETSNEQTRFIHIPRVNWKKQVFFNVEIFIIGVGGEIDHIEAKSGILRDNLWVLRSASYLTKNTNEPVTNKKNIQLKTDLDFSTVFSSFSDPKKILLKNLPEFINQLERDGYDVKEAKTYYYSERVSPLFLVLMALIGSVFALAPLRGGGTGLRAISAISTGFIFFGMAKLAESMAKAGDVPILVGVLIVPIVGILLGTSLLLHQEDG